MYQTDVSKNITPAVACFVPASTLFGDKDDLRQQAHDTNYVKDRLKAIASRVAYDYDPSSTTKQRIPIIDGDYPLAKSYDQLIGEYTIDGQKCRGFMVYVPLVR
jgi:hypothetical protein